MPAEPRGEVRNGSARITWRGRERETFPLPQTWTDEVRQARANVLAKMALSFRKSKVLDDPRAIELVKMAASADAAMLDHLLTVANQLTGGMMPTLQEPESTLGDLAPRWLKLRRALVRSGEADKRRGAIAETTFTGNEEHMRMHLIPMLGDEQLRSFAEGPERLRRFVKALRAKPKTRNGKNKTRVPIPGTVISDRRVLNVFSTLSQFFEDAISEDWFKLASNPAKHPKVLAELPKVETRAKEDVVFVRREAAETAVRLEPDEEIKQRLEFLFLCGTDLGEMGGVTWKHLGDLDAPIPTTNIMRCFTRLGKFGQTKRPSRVRKVPQHPHLNAMLKSRKENQWVTLTGRHPRPDDPVFPNVRVENGVKTVEPCYWHGATDALQTALGHAECPMYVNGHRVTAKGARRSFATWLRQAKVPRELRAQLLGHATQSVTANHYEGEDLKTLHEAVCSIPWGTDAPLTSTPVSGDDPARGDTRGDDCPPIAPDKSSNGGDSIGKVLEAHNKAPVAQGIEQRFPKPWVVRSNRIGGADIAEESA